MPRALVTGATGFVGSNLVAYLRRTGWEVNCLVRDALRAAPLEKQGATLYRGDLATLASRQQALAATDVVFHLAGRVRALRSQEFQADNVDGTRRVLETAAACSQPPVVVYVSSLAAGGPSLEPRRETDADQPISDYGRSKRAAEQAAASFASRVPLTVVRPPIIFGAADQASLAIFQGVHWLRLHPVPGFRRFPVSLVHVADFCAALVRIAERGERVVAAGSRPPGQGMYYVAAERNLDYRELGQLVAQALGHRALALPLPQFLFWIVGGAMELVGQFRGHPSVINLDKVREAVAPGWVCSDQKIRDTLGYQPAAPLAERFAATATWYREHGWL